jgi:hypothetical protein
LASVRAIKRRQGNYRRAHTLIANSAERHIHHFACTRGESVRGWLQITYSNGPPPTPPPLLLKSISVERAHNDLKSTFTSLEAIVPRAQKVHLPFAQGIGWTHVCHEKQGTKYEVAIEVYGNSGFFLQLCGAIFSHHDVIEFV